MILQALHELAVREDLVPDLDFEIKPISWVVRVGDDGRLIKIESWKQAEKLPEDSKKKPKLSGLPQVVPFQGGSTSGDRAFFLVGKSEYALGLDPAGEREPKVLQNRLRLFQEQVEKSYLETKNSAVLAVSLFLTSLLNGDLELSLPDGCLSNDLFAFSHGLDDCFVHEIEDVRKYWKKLRAEKNKEQAISNVCLVTGQFSAMAEKIPLIKKIPGGGTSGVALVSFNKAAFESYGWKEKPGKPVVNATISSGASRRAMTAVNRLIDPNYPDPKDTNRTLACQHVKLSSDTMVCYWTKDEEEYSFAFAIEVDKEKVVAQPEQVAEMYKSLWKGVPYHLAKPNRFYSLVLSGGQGRATVRDWLETNTQTVVESLAQYFADLKIVRRCPAPEQGGHPDNFPLSLLLEAISNSRKNRKDGIPPAVGVRFYQTALDKEQLFPQAAFFRAITRYRVEVAKEKDKKNGWSIKNYNDARAAIIKAYLNRKNRIQKGANVNEEVNEKMNPNFMDKGYLLGQLMSVLEKLQSEALGNVNASIVDRYFSGASTAPKSVFGSLLRNARHHARKAKDIKEKRGAIFNLERLIDQICDQFAVTLSEFENPRAVHENGFPAILTSEQQGMFVLGYHQMRKWLWMKREERDLWNLEHEDAPRAYIWKTKKNKPEDQNDE